MLRLPKKAQPITIGHEDILWEKGLPGDHSPQALNDTVVFYIGMCFRQEVERSVSATFIMPHCTTLYNTSVMLKQFAPNFYVVAE